MPGWVTCTSSSYQSPSRSMRSLGSVQPSGRFSVISTLAMSRAPQLAQLALLFAHFTARLGRRTASPRTAVKHHARVADGALGVRPHPVSLQRATPAVESVKDGVDRRQAADAAAIPVSGDTVEERLGVAPFDRLQHLPILGLDPGALGLCNRARIAEAGAHVGEIGARDQCDAPAARCDGLSE